MACPRFSAGKVGNPLRFFIQKNKKFIAQLWCVGLYWTGSSALAGSSAVGCTILEARNQSEAIWIPLRVVSTCFSPFVGDSKPGENKLMMAFSHPIPFCKTQNLSMCSLCEAFSAYSVHCFLTCNKGKWMKYLICCEAWKWKQRSYDSSQSASSSARSYL